MSASAPAPVSRMVASAARAYSGSDSTTCSAAPAWTTIDVTEWATMSCSSRAIRVRSSTTAVSACSAAATSAAIARSVDSLARRSDLDSPNPKIHTVVKTPQWKTISLGVCSSSTNRSKYSSANAPPAAPQYGARPRPYRAMAKRATPIGTNWPQNRT